MNSQVLTYYTSHSVITDPGEYTAHLDVLPTDMAELHNAIDGLMIHVSKAEKHHPQLWDKLKKRQHDVSLRHMERVLEKILSLDSRPLNIARPVEKRPIVDCRHFAAFLCTVLRHQGAPARARNGFATYLDNTNHWVCEYWNADKDRWVIEDADFQKHDVSRDEFMPGGRAWQICRESPDKGDFFGYSPIRGAWTIRENLIRDFAALNGFECASADCWGLTMKEDKDLTLDDITLLDRAAVLSLTDGEFSERRSLYEASEDLRVPSVIYFKEWVLDKEFKTVEWQQMP